MRCGKNMLTILSKITIKHTVWNTKWDDELHWLDLISFANYIYRGHFIGIFSKLPIWGFIDITSLIFWHHNYTTHVKYVRKMIITSYYISLFSNRCFWEVSAILYHINLTLLFPWYSYVTGLWLQSLLAYIIPCLVFLQARTASGCLFNKNENIGFLKY